MKRYSTLLLKAYEGRIINIHPAYLPEFPELTELKTLGMLASLRVV